MTAPIEAILRAKAENPLLGHKKIARMVGSSAGVVARALRGEIKTRDVVKVAQVRRRTPYAGKP